MQIGEPSANLLAQAGYITNEAGRIFEPPGGALDLPWLLNVSKEARRQARETLATRGSVADAHRWSWFIASTEKEFGGLRFLREKDWRRALKAWDGSGTFPVHNRATLHRALYFSGRSERPDAHIRECLRLYHFLSENNPRQPLYRAFQEELIEHLKSTILQAHQSGDDQSAAKSLRLLSQTVGGQAVSRLQEQFFGRDLEAFRIDCARVQKELLSFQGLAHAPALSVLRECEQTVSQSLSPLAGRFSMKLVEGSSERNEVEKLMAQVCGILAQSFVKAKDSRTAKKWMGEALRWEPSAVKDWRDLPEEDWGEEDTAVVKFPELQKESDEEPKARGNRFLGIQSATVSRVRGEVREECLESLYVLGFPLVPLRRFAAFRNLESGEVGYYLKIPLTTWDHVRQGIAILALSFLVTLSAVGLAERSKDRSQPAAATIEETKQQIQEHVDRLAALAQKEAKLTQKTRRTTEEEKALEAIGQERTRLIQELQRLEKTR